MTMPAELSSNWKKLQAQIKSESSAGTKTAKAPAAQSTAKTTKTANGNGHATTRVAGQKRPHSGDDATARKRRTTDKPAGKAASTKPTIAKRTKSTNAMGVTQSSQPSMAPPISSSRGAARAPSPSLALWAADHDIAPEDLAQAYGLAGTGRGGPRSYLARARGGGSLPADGAAALAAAAADDQPNAGLTPGLVVGKYVALDCEMVGVAGGADGADGRRTDALARVSVVDFFGRQVYDSYVQLQPGQRVVDWRTAVSGVTPRHVRADAGARPFAEVRAVVAGLLAGRVAAAGADDGGTGGTGGTARILVGHDVKHDLRVLALSHPPRLVRDTARFGGFKKYGNGPKPALRVLARELLGVAIQQGAHSSVEDARITMELFRLHKPAFDVEHANTFRDDAAAAAGTQKGRTARKKKKKH